MLTPATHVNGWEPRLETAGNGWESAVYLPSRLPTLVKTSVCFSKLLGSSRCKLHELKLPFLSPIEFIRSKLSFCRSSCKRDRSTCSKQRTTTRLKMHPSPGRSGKYSTVHAPAGAQMDASVHHATCKDARPRNVPGEGRGKITPRMCATFRLPITREKRRLRIPGRIFKATGKPLSRNARS